jgi:hypothetical protein
LIGQSAVYNGDRQSGVLFRRSEWPADVEADSKGSEESRRDAGSSHDHR